MDPYELFVRELRYALNHLYEPELLRHSPLQELIGKSDRPQASLAEFLTAAIEALKPPINEAANSPAWHVYELLYYRYVQRASQGDLAKQLACSIRQVRREQAHALSVLAENLARQAGYAHDEWPQWDDEGNSAADGADDPLRDERVRLPGKRRKGHVRRLAQSCRRSPSCWSLCSRDIAFRCNCRRIASTGSPPCRAYSCAYR